MRRADGTWIKPPPSYPAIKTTSKCNYSFVIDTFFDELNFEFEFFESEQYFRLDPQFGRIHSNGPY